MATALFPPLSLSPSLSPPSFPSLVSEEKYKKITAKEGGRGTFGESLCKHSTVRKTKKNFLKKGKLLCKRTMQSYCALNIWGKLWSSNQVPPEFPVKIKRRTSDFSRLRGRGGGDDGKEAGREDSDQKLVSLFSFFFSLRGCKEMNSGIVILFLFFSFFVLFNIKPYLLYWKLQRLLSLMISEFHKAHIKSFLTKIPATVFMPRSCACLCF